MSGDESADADSDEFGITRDDTERIRAFLQTPMHERDLDDLGSTSDE